MLPSPRVCGVPTARVCWHHWDTSTSKELPVTAPEAAISRNSRYTLFHSVWMDFSTHWWVCQTSLYSLKPLWALCILLGCMAFRGKQPSLTTAARELRSCPKAPQGYGQQAGLQLAPPGAQGTAQGAIPPLAAATLPTPSPGCGSPVPTSLGVYDCAANSEGLWNEYDPRTNWANLLLEGCSLCQTSLPVMFVSILIKLGGIHIQWHIHTYSLTQTRVLHVMWYLKQHDIWSQTELTWNHFTI